MEESRLYFMCTLTEKVSGDTVVSCRASNAMPPFHQFYSAIGSTLLDACHARDGVFWIHDPSRQPQVQAERLPLENAKALLLEPFGSHPAVAAQ
jgi:hypothetical protein